ALARLQTGGEVPRSPGARHRWRQFGLRYRRRHLTRGCTNLYQLPARLLHRAETSVRAPDRPALRKSAKIAESDGAAAARCVAETGHRALGEIRARAAGMRTTRDAPHAQLRHSQRAAPRQSPAAP